MHLRSHYDFRDGDASVGVTTPTYSGVAGSESWGVDSSTVTDGYDGARSSKKGHLVIGGDRRSIHVDSEVPSLRTQNSM